MELYNFFTEVTDNEEKIEEMKYCLKELNNIVPKPNFVELIKYKNRYNGKDNYSIVGQLYGEDTNIGDTELLVIFSNLEYIWFDAYMPSISMKINKGKVINK